MNFHMGLAHSVECLFWGSLRQAHRDWRFVSFSSVNVHIGSQAKQNQNDRGMFVIACTIVSLKKLHLDLTNIPGIQKWGNTFQQPKPAEVKFGAIWSHRQAAFCAQRRAKRQSLFDTWCVFVWCSVWTAGWCSWSSRRCANFAIVVARRRVVVGIL